MEDKLKYVGEWVDVRDITLNKDLENSWEEEGKFLKRVYEKVEKECKESE